MNFFSIFFATIKDKLYLCTNIKRNMKSKSEILSLLRRYKPTAQKKYGITKLGIFGSVARGEQTTDSDVDICYEGKAPSFLTLDMIQTELEQLFGCKVDMVRIRENMNSLLRQRILRDGIYV
jgi:hypothetical protein